MTVASISSSPAGAWPGPNKLDLEGAKHIDPAETVQSDLEDITISDETSKKLEAALDSLVLKPSPVSIEERLDQVISFEEMKNLLSMMAKSSKMPGERKNSHIIDVKR
ncbi:MAG: hypothetical protein IT569_02445 [Leptospiraceae bacterium]|nr:hypothetical protein [Leptospiraceae bacterium]